MRKGRPEKVDWRVYRTKYFEFAPESYSGPECGAYALHTLTKAPMSQIMKHARKDGHWPDKTMFSFLRARGFELIPITIGNTVEAHSSKRWLDKPSIRKTNVILLDQMCYREESTWSVIYDGKIAHSGSVDDMSPVEFLNCPINAAYIVWHPSWAKKPRRKRMHPYDRLAEMGILDGIKYSLATNTKERV
jgi:hypothetical protein